MKWEYIALHGGSGVDLDAMNELGRQGWELVSTTLRPAATWERNGLQYHVSDEWFLIFKRPLKESAA